MMNHFLEDRQLIKIKDIVLIIGAIAGLLAGFTRVYSVRADVDRIMPIITSDHDFIQGQREFQIAVLRRLDMIEKHTR